MKQGISKGDERPLKKDPVPIPQNSGRSDRFFVRRTTGGQDECSTEKEIRPPVQEKRGFADSLL
jgi:hypothetical protein